MRGLTTRCRNGPFVLHDVLLLDDIAGDSAATVIDWWPP